jgi:hypothetical protein
MDGAAPGAGTVAGASPFESRRTVADSNGGEAAPYKTVDAPSTPMGVNNGCCMSQKQNDQKNLKNERIFFFV